MIIRDLELIPVSYKLEEPLRWGTFSVSEKSAIIVRVITDEGVVGYGEAGLSVKYFPEVKAIVERDIKPVIIGSDPFYIEKLFEEMFIRTHGWGRRGVQTYAISGVEMALWDIVGKVCRRPLYQLFGAYRDSVKAYAAPSLKPVDVIVRECMNFADSGFKAIKLRLGFGLDKDLDLVRKVRDAVGSDVTLMVDANMSYDFRQALRITRELERLDVYWIEEPIMSRSLEEYVRLHKKLAERVGIYVAGGECLMTKWEFTRLIAEDAVDIVQPDAALVGGISECRKVAILANSWTDLLRALKGEGPPSGGSPVWGYIHFV